MSGVGSATIRSAVVKVSGVEWRYHSAGIGSVPLIVLSGSLGASSGTAGLISEMLPATRVIVPEYASVGSVNDCLTAIESILEKEGIENHAIYGGSFGGFIAQCWCRKNPARITHMILSGTGAPDACRLRKNKKALRVMPYQPLSVARIFLRILLWGMLLKTGPGAQKWKREYELLIARLTKADLISRYRVAIDLDSHYRFTPAALPSSVRVLILEGERDRLATKMVREELRSLYPEAKTHVFLGAGHSSMITHSDEWSRIVSEFLQK